jgi:ATP-dependent RNA helicase DeaD
MPFSNTHPALARALEAKGYQEPTPVQAAVLAPEALDRDLLVSAQTGSGKTVAYGMAFASTLLGDAERLPPPREPLALIIAPTRELALQVNRELIWLYGDAGARVVSCVGGMDVRREQRALEGGCHIVVGTPGRLRDHLERGRLDSSKLKVVVLDEADEMLDLGFREDLEFILDAAPGNRRTLLFSATLPKNIVTLARKFQKDAVRVDTLVANQPHGDIEYRALRTAPNEIEHAVVNVLRFYEVRNALVFCKTREAVRHLHAALLERGFSAVALSGELTQNERSNALQSLRDGRARVCVATDVAARGIDLPDLRLVIHADLPNDHETLLHRSGRTGRAGRKGICILLVPFTRRRKAEGLLFAAKVDATWAAPPLPDDIRKRDQERFLEDSSWSEEMTEDDQEMARLLLEKHSAEEIAAAFARGYRSKLPAPEDLVDVSADAGPRRKREERDDRDGRDDQRPPRREREDRPTEDTVWFRMSVGRRNNADPRWLLPIICRLGHVTKKDIGSIKIYDRETKFEIVKSLASKFASATRKTNDEDIVITLADSEAGPRGAGEGKKRPFSGGPKRDHAERPERGERKSFDQTPSDQKPRSFDKKPRSFDQKPKGEMKWASKKPGFGKGKPAKAAPKGKQD